jgi:hypothetical protein
VIKEFLAQVDLSKVEALGEAADSWRPEDSEAAEGVRRLEEALRDWLALPGHVRALGDAIWDLTEAGEVEKAAAMAERWSKVLQAFFPLLDILSKAVEKAKGLGYDVEGADVPVRVKAELSRLLEEFDHYPRFTREVFDEAPAAQASGEFIDALDAFAAMKGVTRDEMERRLEEHRQKRGAFGWE